MIAAALLVRDEAAILARCLDSLGQADEIVILDTGSEDGTLELARARGAIVYETPWVDFGTCRTLLLELAPRHSDRLLLLDADMTLAGVLPPSQAVDALWPEIVHGDDPPYRLPLLLRAGRDYRYVGVTHEYLGGYETSAPAETFALVHHCDGSRRPRKFVEDERLLRAQLAEQPDDERAVFYLANTLRDLGRTAEAIELYEQRAGMGGWQAEAEAALVQAHRLRLGVGGPVEMPTPAL